MSKEAVSDGEIERSVGRRVFLIALVFFPVVAAINASSLVTDAVRNGDAVDLRLPWVYELTSVATMLALIPLVVLFERRFAVPAVNWPRAVVAHLFGSVAFCALHIVGMVALRHAILSTFMDQSYRFFDDPLTDLIYEYRKDLFPYVVFVLLLSFMRTLEEHRREAMIARREARESGKLTLKSGGRTIFVDAQSTEWARAAGNYAEIRVAGRTHLPRISLTALEEQLRAAGVDVVRVHRSHIVNRDMIAEIAPTGDGDFRIRLRDGSEIRGSRRYRQQIAV